MTPLWKKDASIWTLLSPAGFTDEKTLHALVEQATQALPLAGCSRLVIVGREVMLGGGFADLVGVEPTGRLAVIELKLAWNSEARRAIVAQVLTYADHLRGRGYNSLAGAVAASDQEGRSTPRRLPPAWRDAWPRAGSASSWSSTRCPTDSCGSSSTWRR
jgi:hypothetical protein